MFNIRYIIALWTVLTVSNYIFSADTVSTKFMPLKTGNTFTYRHTGGFPPPIGTTYYYRCTVSKDTVIGSHTYYFLDKTEHFSPGNLNYHWFRVDSADGKLVCYSPGACGTSVLYTFDSLSANINNTFKSCPSDSLVHRKLVSVINNTRWNIPTIDKEFNWNSGPAGVFRRYSKFFGLTYSGYGEMNPAMYDLTGCVINGVLYGDTNTFTGYSQVNTEIPSEASLSQNYPNPFNPVTNIKFQIPPSVETSRWDVLITIYDALGKEVAVIVNRQLQPGAYTVDWDASLYPSGVYYYRLETENYTETKKMVLIK